MQQATKYGQLFEERCNLPLGKPAQFFDDQLKKDPTNVDLWMKKGIALLDYRHMYREGVEAVCTGLSYDPFHYESHLNRGFMYIKMHRFAEAAAEYRLASRMCREEKEPLYYLAMMYFYLEDYTEADRIYDQIWRMDEGEYNWCAVATWHWFTLKILGHHEKAAQILNRISLNQKPVGTVGPLGNVYYDQSYFIHCLLFKGLLAPEAILEDTKDKDDYYFVMMSFFVAVYYEFTGREGDAFALYREMLARLGDSTSTVLVVQMMRRIQTLSQKIEQ